MEGRRAVGRKAKMMRTEKAHTFGTVRRGLGGAAARPGPSSLYQM